jgi:hypothetical protein
MRLTTETLAAQLGVKPCSIRSHLCRKGSYFGLRPQRLPNGRLLWPENAVDLLLKKTDNVTASDEAA